MKKKNTPKISTNIRCVETVWTTSANSWHKNPDYLREQDEDGYTPPHHEAIAGNAPLVKAMLELGADPAATTQEGLTALDFARLMDWQNVIEILEPRH